MAMDADTFQQLLDTIRRFVEERLIPLEHQVANDDVVPKDLKREMSEMGLFGLTIPEEYGGIGVNMEEEI